MERPDLNLLITLDALLAEGSVAGAARRLRLSPSAMSRALARLRSATGDPLLVRAGRGFVPTPRATELVETVSQLVQDAEAALRPAATLAVEHLIRTFTLRTSDGFAETFAPALIALLQNEAPGVRLRFVAKIDRDSKQLRDGSIDLETGVVGKTISPEVRAQLLFHDRFIGVVRSGHPLCTGKITPDRYRASNHILVSRRGRDNGPIDDAMSELGVRRNIVAIVGGFAAALAIARGSDLIAGVPERHTASFRNGMFSFALPFPMPQFGVSLLWRPRMDADPVHQ